MTKSEEFSRHSTHTVHVNLSSMCQMFIFLLLFSLRETLQTNIYLVQPSSTPNPLYVILRVFFQRKILASDREKTFQTSAQNNFGVNFVLHFSLQHTHIHCRLVRESVLESTTMSERWNRMACKSCYRLSFVSACSFPPHIYTFSTALGKNIITK